MNQASASPALLPEPELYEALDRVLSEYYSTPRRVVGLKHQPSIYVSSFAIEELHVRLEDGTHLELLLKDLNAASKAAEQIKPAFVRNPLREIEVYRQILKQSSPGTPEFYGAWIHPARSRYWLLLENVAGLELFHAGDFQVWENVARWIARFQNEFEGDGLAPVSQAHLLNYDRAYYATWMQRAVEFAGAGAAQRLGQLSRNYDVVVERLVRLPRTFIHGEFYASNILLAPSMRGLRICPVDWEMAAIAPGVMDVAALAAGNWTEEQKSSMALAYYAESGLNRALSRAEFLDAFDACRMHQAVQWLGWTRDWDVPPEHAHDWLNEAMTLAERRGLLR
jgi:hypothetical protein